MCATISLGVISVDKTTNNYTIRIPNDTRETLQKMADEQGRSLSNMILWIIRNEVERYEKEGST